MSTLRVTMLSKLYPPWLGGLELHVAGLAGAITKAHPDIQVSVVSGQERRARSVSEEVEGVSVRRAATLARVFRTPITSGMRRLIRDTQPDVFHFHSPNPWGEWVAPLAEVATTPVVVTYHHDVVRQKRLLRLYRPILERLLRRADRIVAWSPEFADTSPMLQRHRDKVAVIPGGIDTDRFMPTARSRERARVLRSALAPTGPVVLYVGRLVYYKGLDYLFRAMQDVQATLVVVGRGALLPTLRALAQDLGIDDRTRFLTDVGDDDLPLYYQASDLLVLPSCEPTETFGLVQVEAHASGIPSICTALGTGVTFANRDGVSGLVVPPRDAASLAAAVNRLLEDAPLRVRLGAQAQRRAREQFDIRRCASEMAALYRELTRTASHVVS